MLDRRLFLYSVLASIGAACSPNQGIEPQLNKKTYVLVHGAWHGGWCWEYVKRHLEAKGHTVFTPTMAGLGERAHLNNRNINLTTHMNDIIQLIERENLKDVILVGHSYAGYVVSLVADRLKDKVSHLVYLDAALPKEGLSFIPEASHSDLKEKYDEHYTLPIAGLSFLGIPENHAKADWVKSQLTPHPLGTMFEKNNQGIVGLPKTFIRAMGNPRYKNGDPIKDMTDSDAQWAYDVIDTGHDVMVTEPGLLAEMLLKIE